jgi:transcriptional regulator with GAF, ATPase, and Fis domain
VLVASRHFDFFRLLSCELSPDNLLDRFMSLLLDVQRVERGSIWVDRDGFYECVTAAGEESDEKIKGLKLPKEKPSIVKWVIENGRRTIAAAGRDKRHYSEAEKDLSVKSNLILAFPLFLKDGSVYGCIEIIDTSAGGDRMNLSDEYLELLQGLVDVCSIALSNSVEFMDRIRETDELRRTISAMRDRPLLSGPSPAFQDLNRMSESYARTDYPVLITGESGTGKEILAREIHKRSGRAEKPFLVQNCSAIPSSLLASELFGYKKGAFTGALTDKQGLFAAAHGGTLFLDEIGDMNVDLQATLLRTLQDGEIKPLGGTATRKVDVRIISATNMDLEKAIRQGTFREDLYFRLNVLPAHLPPIRERLEDIPYFLRHFLTRESLRLGMRPKELSAEAMRLLTDYSWPGNIRELENFAKQVLVSCPNAEIGVEDLPPRIRRSTRGDAPEASAREEPAGVEPFKNKDWEQVERDYIEYLLESNRWVVSRAAEQAGLKRSTFDSRMKKLGIRKNA